MNMIPVNSSNLVQLVMMEAPYAFNSILVAYMTMLVFQNPYISVL